ncbi:ComF family protein [Cohnella candidum]|uniref:ComF family protein n=1 Tax=Cohnella candidum TaxID=2674991 RepID=UPI0019D12259|nr:ComF family protein [Cohnella candidum]
MRELLALYKYRGSEKLEPLMGAILSAAYERICRELGTDGLSRSPFHAVTSVPLAKERLEERGFNQAERMASRVAKRYGVPYRQLLRRVRHTEKQSLKTRSTRLTDMRGNFQAVAESIGEWMKEVDGVPPARILLVDDVYTTGSTMNECASVLQNAFCESARGSQPRLEIYGLLWARS